MSTISSQHEDDYQFSGNQSGKELSKLLLLFEAAVKITNLIL